MKQPADPIIKIKVSMPASLHQRLAQRARQIRSNVSQLCCEGARMKLAGVEPDPTDQKAPD